MLKLKNIYSYWRFTKLSQTRQTTIKQENYAKNNKDVIEVQKTLLEILLLSSKNRTLSDNILRVQESAIIKSSNCSRDLLNKT